MNRIKKSRLCILFVCFIQPNTIISQKSSIDLKKQSTQELITLLQQAKKLDDIRPGVAFTIVNNAKISAQSQQTYYGEDFFNRVQENGSLFYRCMQEYKWHLGAGSVVTLYLYIQYILYYYSWMTYQSSSWTHWKKEISTDLLVGYNHQALAQDLLKAIQIRYVDVQNQGNILLPIAQFLKELDREIQDAQRYVWWYECLDRFYGKYTFFLRVEKYQEVKDARTRLEFLKSLFISWFTKYIVLGNM